MGIINLDSIFKALFLIIISCGNCLAQSNKSKNSLFVFVGEKISIEPLTYKGGFDQGFKAKYRILKKVYGTFDREIIEFNAYDHYGYPAFGNYKTVLLFVSKKEGKYYHEKYQFFDVYKTKDGRWAGSYSINDYGHEYNRNTTIKPERIHFAQEVSYPTTGRYLSGGTWTMEYPKPYYRTVGNKAIAVYGNYIPELFQLKKNGVLKARGLF